MVFGRFLGGGKKAPPLEDGPVAAAPRGEGDKLGGGDKVAGAARNALTVNEFVARTKRCREKGLEPTKPELIAYARYLGIDPFTDGDLMWVAEEALAAPLPSEWTEHHDSSDRVFYYNVISHASSWTHPLEQVHRDTYKKIVTFRTSMPQHERSSELERMRRDCDAAEREAHQELHLWTEHTDDQGQKFYFNPKKQQSVWTDPRPAICHVLYLKMKALRVLSTSHCGQSTSPRGPEPLSKKHIIEDRPRGRSKDMGLVGPEREGASPRDGEGSGDETGPLEARDKKSKRKKKRKEGRDCSPPAPDVRPRAPSGLPGGVDRIHPVEEVRGALGLGPGGSLPPLGPPGGPRNPRLEFDSMPVGLPQVGRAKVRAGIRLDPLPG